MDAQDVGAVWNASLLIAMDMYEHAFFMDHGTDKKSYIEAFFKTLNWKFVNELATKYGLDKRRNGK